MWSPARTFATSLAVSVSALVGVAFSPFGPRVVPSVLEDADRRAIAGLGVVTGA